MTKAPLEGVLVIDLTQHLAGPFGTQILSDLGATVVKVEPAVGDSTRHLHPYFVGGESAYYLSLNRNKKSIAIDLKSSRGRQLLLDLARRADALIENFRPGTMAKLGLDYAELQTVNPALVVASISGFGQSGPYRDLPAFDIIVQALSGGMSITGEAGGRGVRAGIPIGDIAAGLFGIVGLLSGLLSAKSTGRGSYIDVGMLDCQISLLSYMATYYLVSGQVPGPQGRGHTSIPTYRAFTCKDDKDVVVAANTERMWTGLCRALESEELAEDARFYVNEARLRNRTELDTILEERFRRHDVHDVLERLQENSVPCAPINALDEALSDPQVRHRDMVLTLNSGFDISVGVPGNPIKVMGYQETPKFPPHLGGDAAFVLGEILALSRHDVEDLIREGVVINGTAVGDDGEASTAQDRDLNVTGP